jgi:hypothetical protein
MARLPRFLASAILVLSSLAPVAEAEHVILAGGPALRKWENLRVTEDQHDRWWGNFIRASTLRMAEIRTAYGKDAPLVWIVYREGYDARGREDGKPYTSWISKLAADRRATLIWINSGGEAIRAINSRGSGAIQTFDYFGHSNRYCFMLDYGCDIMAASTAWIHERDLSRLRSSVFAKNAYCKSWGCHTAESMSAKWKSATGHPLEAARGATSYTQVGHGVMPTSSSGWVR